MLYNICYDWLNNLQLSLTLSITVINLLLWESVADIILVVSHYSWLEISWSLLHLLSTLVYVLKLLSILNEWLITWSLSFIVFNFSRSKAANSELVFELMKSYCLPFLLYGFEAATLSGTNACLLNACIDRAVYKHSSVTAVLLQTGLPSGVTLLHNF